MNRPPWRTRLFSPELLATLDAWTGDLTRPAPENRARREGIRIFGPEWLERYFSKAHPIFPIVWTSPFLVWGGLRATQETPGRAALHLFGGLFLWTLLEYGLHRWIFHWEGRGPNGKLWSFMVHGYHHEFPEDRMRLVAPPLMLIFFGTLLVSGLRLLFGPAGWPQVFAGICVGYVAYDWTHYYTHHFHPRRGIGRWLKEYHLRHHFAGEEGRFGISTPFWDLVFGTYRGLGRSTSSSKSAT